MTSTATDWTVSEMRREVAHSYLAGDRDGIYARVELPGGSSLELSRLEGETDWTADASWGKGSFPHWANGYGARYLMTKVVSDARLAAELDARAAAL